MPEGGSKEIEGFYDVCGIKDPLTLDIGSEIVKPRKREEIRGNWVLLAFDEAGMENVKTDTKKRNYTFRMNTFTEGTVSGQNAMEE